MAYPGEDGKSRSLHDRLRAELLVSALPDLVPLAQVESAITRDDAADTTTGQQQLAVEVIRSLLEGGLMEIGELPYPGGTFPAWNLSVDAAMDRLADLFVGHHDEPDRWEFTVWLRLTPAGNQIARALSGRTE